MLLEGASYTAIKKELNVGDETISRINNWLKAGAVDLMKVSKRFLSQEGELTKESTGKRRYMAGNLLTPAIDEGLRFAAKKYSESKKKRRRKG
jgi:hypothetical protein